MPDSTASRPVNPDIDLHVPAQRAELRWAVLAAVSAGGALGSLARYGVTSAFPHRAGEFGWSTFGINVAGCLLLGALMVLLEEVWPDRTLLRPFLGVGILGGFTTFSSYVVDALHGFTSGAAGAAFGYLIGTLAAALAAVWLGAAVARWAVHRGRSGAGAR